MLTPSVKICLTLLVIGLLTGLGIGYIYFTPRLTYMSGVEAANREQLSSAEERITELEEELRNNEAERIRLETLLSTLNANLTHLSRKLLEREAELGEALRELESAKEEILSLRGERDLGEAKISDLREILSKLEKDRILLVYLRMDLPDTRQLAHEHWSIVKEIAIQSDPSLGPKVDTIIAYIDAYFDWIETQPEANASMEEYANWLFTAPPGVFEYDDAVDAFYKDALLVVIMDIKIAVDILD